MTKEINEKGRNREDDMKKDSAATEVTVDAKFYMLYLLHHYCTKVRIMNTGPGIRAKACCPFHNEQTPSFIADLTKGTYHCFGCGITGNAIDLIMAKEGLARNEAVEWLIKRHGADVLDYISVFSEPQA